MVNSNTHLRKSHSQTCPKNRRGETLLNSYYEANIILIPQPEKEIPREDKGPKFLMNVYAQSLNNPAAY